VTKPPPPWAQGWAAEAVAGHPLHVIPKLRHSICLAQEARDMSQLPSRSLGLWGSGRERQKGHSW
jgi:hypothetical protein